MNNSVVMFIFPVFDGKYAFLKTYSINQNSLFKLKFRTQINSNMQNSMVIFILFRSEVLFWVNLVQKLKSQPKTKFGIVCNLLINYLNLIIQKQLPTSVLQKSILRSSLSPMFFKIVVLKIFAVITRKHLRWSLLIKLQA